MNAYAAANPDKKIIRLGIGDVTQPLPAAVVEALHKAVDEMADASTFHGYAPDLGYEFLRNAIVENDFRARGCDIRADEIFCFRRGQIGFCQYPGNFLGWIIRLRL